MTFCDLASSTPLVIFLAATLCGLSSDAPAADAKPIVELWPEGAPGSEGKDGKEAVRSAGGELAALTAQGGGDGDAKAVVPVERESSRAAFQVLVYPGRSESIMPSAQSPPAFLLCGEDDRPDISQGLVKVYLRFKEVAVSAELHVLAGVGHGFGVRASHQGPTARWLELVRGWLDARGFLASGPRR